MAQMFDRERFETYFDEQNFVDLIERVSLLI